MKVGKSVFWWILILLLALGLNYINYTSYVSSDKEILELNNKIDSLTISTEKLQIDRDSLSFRIRILTDSLIVQSFKIDSLKAKKNETLSDITTFTNTDITKFFTNRYGYDIRSTAELCSQTSN